MAFAGQAKTDYQREYMRRLRAGVRPVEPAAVGSVRPVEPTPAEFVRPITDEPKQYVIPAKPYIERPFDFIQPPVCSDRELALKFTNGMYRSDAES
jgi:hypothetical protein